MLRTLGRLVEALGPLRAGSEADFAAEDWTNAARAFSNLSELLLTLGDIPAAFEVARRSVDSADRSGDRFLQSSFRTTLADLFHQSGDLAEAARLFRDAEKMHAELQPYYPILYGLRGCQYCDLLLGQNQAAEALRRAQQTLEWARMASGVSLLDIALQHLSLGRVHPSGSAKATQHLEEAVNGLRKAGVLDHLPLGLLARAANYRHLRDFPRAQHDLDEVRILATRCGMRLHLTDYHLEQARLFFAQSQPDAARPHYEAANKLVQETGYRRRDPELAALAAQLAPVANP